MIRCEKFPLSAAIFAWHIELFSQSKITNAYHRHSNMETTSFESLCMYHVSFVYSLVLYNLCRGWFYGFDSEKRLSLHNEELGNKHLLMTLTEMCCPDVTLRGRQNVKIQSLTVKIDHLFKVEFGPVSVAPKNSARGSYSIAEESIWCSQQ